MWTSTGWLTPLALLVCQSGRRTESGAMPVRPPPAAVAFAARVMVLAQHQNPTLFLCSPLGRKAWSRRWLALQHLPGAEG